MAAARHKIRAADVHVDSDRMYITDRGYAYFAPWNVIMLYTGRQPTKRTFEMVCFLLSGWASLEELERHIESLPQPM